MNLLIFEDGDLKADGSLQVNGRRAEHLIDVLRVSPGKSIRVGKLNGSTGSAVVTRIESNQVWLELGELDAVIPSAMDMTLLLCMPRPQSLKKVLQSSAALGVKRTILISSERVEQSYYSSPVLKDENILHQLLLGLEQAGVTDQPAVEIWPEFFPARRDRSQAASAKRERLRELMQGSVCLLPHPPASSRLAQVFGVAEISKPVILAIGPEGGFIDTEISALEDLGFRAFTMGNRVLRVETAVDVLIGQVQLLAELRSERP